MKQFSQRILQEIMKSIVILGTSNNWSVTCLSKWTSKSACYIINWWVWKKQMVLVIVDAQRPMHRSAHVQKAGDCLLKKKKQIRFFMQLEMIWIRSVHLPCTYTHLIFELEWYLKANPQAGFKTCKYWCVTEVPTTATVQSNFWTLRIRILLVKCADINIEDG